MSCGITLPDIRPATLRDVTYVASYMRAADRREIVAILPATDTEIGAALWSGSSDAWCAWSDGSPQVAWGFSPGFPGLLSGWAIMTERGVRLMPAVTRFMLRTIRPALLAGETRRIEVRTAIDHDVSHRWLEALGFVREGIARDYGSGGLDYVIYAATRRGVEDDEQS